MWIQLSDSLSASKWIHLVYPLSALPCYGYYQGKLSRLDLIFEILAVQSTAAQHRGSQYRQNVLFEQVMVIKFAINYEKLLLCTFPSFLSEFSSAAK